MSTENKYIDIKEKSKSRSRSRSREKHLREFKYPDNYFKILAVVKSDLFEKNDERLGIYNIEWKFDYGFNLPVNYVYVWKLESKTIYRIGFISQDVKNYNVKTQKEEISQDWQWKVDFYSNDKKELYMQYIYDINNAFYRYVLTTLSRLVF